MTEGAPNSSKTEKDFSFVEKAVLYEELIKNSGIKEERVKKILDLLNKSTDQIFFMRAFADYVSGIHPDIFAHDTELKKQVAYGLRPGIVLSDENQTLLNLFREIREDSANY